MGKLLLNLILTLTIVSCGSMEPEAEGKIAYGKNGNEKSSVNRAELQEDLQRFAGVFLDRVNQGAAQLEANLPSSYDPLILRQTLLYSSNVVEIATGQTPEVNLPDMVVFITLAKDRLQNYWIPQKFKGYGQGMLEAFEKSEKEIWEITAKVAAYEQQLKIRNLITKWMIDNPEQILVERVRLKELSVIAGNVENKRAEETAGAFGIKIAVSTADQGVVLANRALFLSQQFPYLLRLETRLASKQILSDSLKTLKDTETNLAQMQQEFSPMVGDMTFLARESINAMKEVESLIKVFRENFPLDESVNNEGKIEGVKTIVKRLHEITNKVVNTSVKAKDIVRGTRAEIDGVIWTIALAAMAVILFLGIIGWGGYFIFVRKLKT